MTELCKRTKAERAVKRLEKLKKRKQDRWRLDTDRNIGLTAFIVVLTAVGAYVGALLGSMVWWPLAPIIIGSTWSFLIERGARNLYEKVVIYQINRSVNKFRKAGDIFEVEPVLTAQWKNTVTELGGDKDHEFVSPQKHVVVFDQLVELEEARKHELTSAEGKVEIAAAMDKLIKDTVAPLIGPMKLEKAHAKEIAGIDASTAEELHNHKVKELVHRAHTFYDN